MIKKNKLERERDIGKVIWFFSEMYTDAKINEHNCRLHDIATACNNQEAFEMAVKDSKKTLLKVSKVI